MTTTNSGEPLAHTVYIEMGEKSYGIVLIFGYQKIFVPLPSAVERMPSLHLPLRGCPPGRDINQLGTPTTSASATTVNPNF
jgi:hypothetical protein